MSSIDRADKGELVEFRCNVCGARGRLDPESVDRERASCETCRSSVRTRALVHFVSTELFGEDLEIHAFPQSERSGLGFSELPVYVERLERKLTFVNTYYHKEPRLDIHNVGDEYRHRFDFVICSEVLEHVDPPVGRAIENLHSLLKPGGLLILTVPWVRKGDTVEHFPDLYHYEVVTEGKRTFMRNRTRSGEEQIFEGLRFHGGPGATLEMRLFSRSGLLADLADAGFHDPTPRAEPVPSRGIYWRYPWSLPITARA